MNPAREERDFRECQDMGVWGVPPWLNAKLLYTWGYQGAQPHGVFWYLLDVQKVLPAPA